MTKPAIGFIGLGFSTASVSGDIGYFLEMVEDMGTRTQIAEGTDANLKEALVAGLGEGNVLEIYDLFLKPSR